MKHTLATLFILFMIVRSAGWAFGQDRDSLERPERPTPARDLFSISEMIPDLPDESKTECVEECVIDSSGCSGEASEHSCLENGGGELSCFWSCTEK